MLTRLADLPGLTRTLMRSRVFALALLALLATAQGVGQWHMLSERHTICAEHGQIEECDGAPTAHACDDSHSGARFESLSEDGGHGDDHCDVAHALGQSARVASTPAFASIFAAAPVALPAPRFETRSPKQPRFRLAPKQSPPNA